MKLILTFNIIVLAVNAHWEMDNNVNREIEKRSVPASLDNQCRPLTPSADWCNSTIKIDAVTRTANGQTYFFSGDDYALIKYDKIASGFPRNIGKNWPGLPSNLDAAMTWHEDGSGDTFFFKGSSYWRFHNQVKLDGPKPISNRFSGLPGSISAAVDHTNGRIYIFKGSQYYRLNTQKNKTESQYPLSMSYWPGLPREGIDAAFQWSNDHTYFFAGGKYYRWAKDKDVLDSGYPLDNSKNWFGCSSKKRRDLNEVLRKIPKTELENGKVTLIPDEVNTY